MSDWHDDAACRGASPDKWFPERGDSVTAQEALTVCRRCPAVEPCLEAGIWEMTGIWGATTPRDRRRIRVERGLVQAPPPIDHGTPNGYRQHRKREERACPSCLIAWSIYKGYEPRLRVVAEGAA